MPIWIVRVLFDATLRRTRRANDVALSVCSQVAVDRGASVGDELALCHSASIGAQGGEGSAPSTGVVERAIAIP